ncbi:hypothetical protein HZS_5147 [Henneguya salminicola]|nr:hypothetical protein HZS_5147 [Henneguya salminicola]
MKNKENICILNSAKIKNKKILKKAEFMISAISFTLAILNLPISALNIIDIIEFLKKLKYTTINTHSSFTHHLIRYTVIYPTLEAFVCLFLNKNFKSEIMKMLKNCIKLFRIGYNL